MLRDLERDGLVPRHVFSSGSPNVEYVLSPLGRSLLDPLALLMEWADGNQRLIEMSRTRVDEEMSGKRHA